MLGTHEQRTEGMKRQAQELIEQAYQRGYKAGEEQANSIIDEQKTQWIEQGRNEAWETILKIVELPWPERRKVLESECYVLFDLFSSVSASEAIEKLKAWEQKQEQQENKLRVGDEVEFVGYAGKGIVINNKTTYHRILVDDSVVSCHVRDLIPTGRTFPEIAQVLAKMKEGAGE